MTEKAPPSLSYDYPIRPPPRHGSSGVASAASGRAPARAAVPGAAFERYFHRHGGTFNYLGPTEQQQWMERVARGEDPRKQWV